MLCGDEEEHAVLLWCWLTGLGLDCQLVIGDGLPEGPRSSYVLVRHADPSEPASLYNASDGSAYSVDDPYCPLHVVGCVVDRRNVSVLCTVLYISQDGITLILDYPRSVSRGLCECLILFKGHVCLI